MKLKQGDYLPVSEIKTGESYLYQLESASCLDDWYECKVTYLSDEIIVMDCILGAGDRKEQAFNITNYVQTRRLKFKPLKSKADQEREDFIDNLLMMVDPHSESKTKECFGKLYDAGYRKVKPLSESVFKDMYNLSDSAHELLLRLQVAGYIVTEGE